MQAVQTPNWPAQHLMLEKLTPIQYPGDPPPLTSPLQPTPPRPATSIHVQIRAAASAFNWTLRMAKRSWQDLAGQLKT